jgi:D-3-phosphoglycerate dehydrogenase / 2-oxoglutarate reductase
MGQPHILVADWPMADFEIERALLENNAITWSMPTSQASSQGEQIEQLLARIYQAERIDGVLFVLAPLKAEVIAALPSSCKHLQRVGMGLDTVDIEAVRAKGLTLSNTPDYATEEVAVHAMAMILSLHRQLDATQQYLLAGQWRITPPNPVLRLSTLSLGLVGLGRIGRKLAALMRPMVGKLYYSDPADPSAPEGAERCDLEELLKNSDIVSLHCPLLPSTRKLMDTRTLGLMKSNALLINVARGGLIDAEALVDALKHSRLAGAGLDVYEPEVLPADSPLRNLDNVILTSHTAWFSKHSVVDCRTQAVEQMIAAIGDRPKGTV